MKSDTVSGWAMTIRLHHIAHHRCAAHNAKLHRWMGITVILLTSIVGSTVFATLGKSPSPEVVIVTGSLSILAAIMSGLQTFLNYSSLAEQHKLSAAKYGMLRREVEQFLSDPDESREILREFTEGFRARWSQVEQESPTIPQSIHEKSQNQLLQFLQEESVRSASQPMIKTNSAKRVKQANAHSESKLLKANAKLLLIRGLPGSGKSTLARSLKGYVHFEADMYFELSGEFKFDGQKLPDAHAWCLSRAKEQLEKGNSVVVSNTFTRNVEMLPYFELGFPTDVQEASGSWKSVHGVPEEKLKMMRENWEALSIPTPTLRET